MHEPSLFLALAFLSLGAFFGILGHVADVFLVAENAALAFLHNYLSQGEKQKNSVFFSWVATRKVANELL